MTARGEAVPPGGWTPPEYPQERLGELKALAEASGAMLDLSVGDPVDPLPAVVATALSEALADGVGYPASVGSPELRAAAARWMERRLGVTSDPAAVIACVGTKEVVASLPRLLSLRDPTRDTVLFPSIAYPTYAMGATLAGLRAVPVPLDADWHPDLERVTADDAERALVLWLNEPGNPTGSVASAEWFGNAVEWARRRGVLVASDECYVEFADLDGADGSGRASAGATALCAGHDGVLAVHSLSKRSNMAGLRAGFVAGDPALVRYLGEVRRHAGNMVPGPIQVAAAAAWADDRHVDEQRARYAERRRLVLEAIGGTGVEHAGGPGTFYLWLRDVGGRGAWDLAADLAAAGIVGAPGDLYGEADPQHVRVALVAPSDVLRAAAARLRSALGAG